MNPNNIFMEDDFEIHFYEGILRDNPDQFDALTILGDLYTKKGWHEKGLAVEKRLLQLRPEDPYVLYNLACSYSLLNNIDQAFKIMKMAIAFGYQDFDFLKEDTDLTNLLADKRFREYLEERRPHG